MKNLTRLASWVITFVLLLCLGLLTSCGPISEPAAATGATHSNSSTSINTTVNKNPLASSNTQQPSRLPASQPSGQRESQAARSGLLTLHMLDVGQGSSVLLQLDDLNLIMDGGGSDASSFVVAYLKKLDIDRLDIMIASHFDEDHINGLVGVLHQFPVDQVYSGPEGTDTRASNSFLRLIEEKDIKSEIPRQGQSIPFGEATITVLAPFQYGNPAHNDDSISIRIEYGSRSFLLSGDSSSEIEDALIPSLLPTDVVLASHHGSDTSSSLAFLQALNPVAVLISCGRDNPYGFPKKDVLDHIRAVKADLYRTDLQGTVICQTDGIDLSWNTEACTDFSSGRAKELIPNLNPVEPSGTSDAVRSPDPTTESYYVLNTSTKKFHRPDCYSVSQMAEKNKLISYQSREAIIAAGYSPCKNCNP